MSYVVSLGSNTRVALLIFILTYQGVLTSTLMIFAKTEWYLNRVVTQKEETFYISLFLLIASSFQIIALLYLIRVLVYVHQLRNSPAMIEQRWCSDVESIYMWIQVVSIVLVSILYLVNCLNGNCYQTFTPLGIVIVIPLYICLLGLAVLFLKGCFTLLRKCNPPSNSREAETIKKIGMTDLPVIPVLPVPLV